MSSHVNDQLNQIPAGTWKLDPSKTTVTVVATKLGFFSIPATLNVSAGTIEIDASHQVTSVEVTIEANSYASKNDKRNDHVRSSDFLNVDSHPELVFRADAVTKTSGGYQADGMVTVKGQASPLQVEVSDVKATGDHGSLRASATVDRKAIGVDRMPSFIVGRELQLTVDASADLVGPAPEPAA